MTFHSCSNHSNLEMEAGMSDQKLAILEFTYLQNKKWQKQAVKSTRTRKSYRTYCFHFTQITEKTSNSPSKIGNFRHLPPFCSIHEALQIQIFVFLQSMYVRNEAVFLFLEQSSVRGFKQKKDEKKHENLAFKLLLQEIRLKNWTSRKIFKALTSKL